MRLIALAFLLFAGFATPALAQVPPSLRSAGVTEAQWSQAQALISAQARTLNQREAALRTLAIEIFEGEPGLGFETYLELIREGASRLPQALAAARALNPRGDPRLEDLRARAVSAAEAGRLREALALQDEYARVFRAALDRALEQPLLDLAAAHAAAGDTAYALADYLGAAARYAEAAEAAPESARDVRWEHRRRQAEALHQRALRFTEPFDDVVRFYEETVLPLAPRETRTAAWAATQGALANVHFRQGERGDGAALVLAERGFTLARDAYQSIGDEAGAASALMGIGLVLQLQGERGAPGALERAVSAYESALTVMTRSANPTGWALTQMNLGNVHFRRGERGVPGALELAVAAYEAALSIQTREADPAAWALTQMNLGNAFSVQGERGAPGALARAVASYEAAMSVITREVDPAGWASTQINLGAALMRQGEQGTPGALQGAAAAFEAALSMRTIATDRARWAGATYNLAFVQRAMGRFAAARVTMEAAAASFEQIGDQHWANEAREFIARLPSE